MALIVGIDLGRKSAHDVSILRQENAEQLGRTFRFYSTPQILKCCLHVLKRCGRTKKLSLLSSMPPEKPGFLLPLSSRAVATPSIGLLRTACAGALYSHLSILKILKDVSDLLETEVACPIYGRSRKNVVLNFGISTQCQQGFHHFRVSVQYRCVQDRRTVIGDFGVQQIRRLSGNPRQLVDPSKAIS